MAKQSALRPTELRQYYEALHGLFEEEQTTLAETHAGDPTLLAHRLEQSVKVAETYPPIADEFIGRNRKPLPEDVPISEIRSTADFVSRIKRRGLIPVIDSGLAFRYVERELSPLRTTGARRAARRSLDLLLVSEDRLPIAAELKIRADSPTYPALIQALMYAAELVTPQQRERLAREFPKAGFAWPAQGPYIDVFVMAFEAPPKGQFRKRSFEATRLVAEKALEKEPFRRVVRRIAYLDASAVNGQLVFRDEFVFPDLSE